MFRFLNLKGKFRDFILDSIHYLTRDKLKKVGQNQKSKDHDILTFSVSASGMVQPPKTLEPTFPIMQLTPSSSSGKYNFL